MSIVQELTPVFYSPMRLVIEIAPDAILTEDSLRFFSDIGILNESGELLDIDHPMPQTTPAQITAFLAWVQANLTAYENTIGLERHVENN